MTTFKGLVVLMSFILLLNCDGIEINQAQMIQDIQARQVEFLRKLFKARQHELEYDDDDQRFSYHSNLHESIMMVQKTQRVSELASQSLIL